MPLQQSVRQRVAGLYELLRGTRRVSHIQEAAEDKVGHVYGLGLLLQKRGVDSCQLAESLDIRWSRPLPDGATPSTVTVSRDESYRYFVSLLVEEDITPFEPKEKPIGIDLGLKTLVVTSDGQPFANPKYFARDEKKLVRSPRKLARKQQGSKSREKQRRRVARIHARIADRRRHHQHQFSTHLGRSNQTIVVESLAVKNMLQHPTLAKAIADVGWGAFVRQLEYKAAWYERTLIKIDRWYP